jgi:hypothetical protein
MIRMDAIFTRTAPTFCAWLMVCACRKLCVPLCLAVLGVSSALQARDPFESDRHVNLSSLDFKLEEESDRVSRDDADFDKWENIIEEDCEEETAIWHDPSVKTIDWMRHFGLRHSSSDGRYIGRGVPLEGTSWLNRPYHVDWFLGSLLGDNLNSSVNLNNELLAGLRIGYDFDYYWGLDWRFGWSNPNMEVEGADEQSPNGSYFISDIDLKYYPWGDSKVRPFWLMGMGLARVEFLDENDISQNVTLATMPLGVGVEFPQFPWLVWRLEVLDNLAFGADGVNTLNNFAFTAGMEWRLGAKPQSYWPWRPGRKLW